MELFGKVKSVIDEKLMIVRLDDGKEIFLPWCGANVGERIYIAVEEG